MQLHAVGAAHGLSRSLVGRVTRTPLSAADARPDHVVFGKATDLNAFGNDWTGYAAVLSPDSPDAFPVPRSPGVYGVRHLDYLQDGDVVLLLPSGTVNTLYRRTSAHNTILATEQCNSLCLMCSQPPRQEDDSYRIPEILRLIELVDPTCREIGISGGEPTLLGDNLLRIIERFRDRLPSTGLHMLTNGRRFADAGFAQRLGAIDHPDLMLGIPLYSDVDCEHDYVVQARGAYDETVAGLHNLAQAAVLIEIRVVLHAQTYRRLPQLAEHIYRNFPFAAHVALMGLEMFGFVHKNFAALWVDPVEYQSQLEEATLNLAMRGLNVSIYNHQLCTLPVSVWPFARKSISDWKNVYLDVCHDCGVREFCGGFFHSATKKHSAHIKPLSRPADRVVDALRRIHVEGDVGSSSPVG